MTPFLILFCLTSHSPLSLLLCMCHCSFSLHLLSITPFRILATAFSFDHDCTLSTPHTPLLPRWVCRSLPESNLCHGHHLLGLLISLPSPRRDSSTSPSHPPVVNCIQRKQPHPNKRDRASERGIECVRGHGHGNHFRSLFFQPSRLHILCTHRYLDQQQQQQQQESQPFGINQQ
jgi:hypothetical protein